MKPVATATAGVLAGIAGLHVAWGFGSTFPFDDAETLSDSVAGTQAVPGRAACLGVAGLVSVAAIAVAAPHPLPRSLTRLGALGVAVVLAARGVAGVAGRTEQIVGWPTSPRFVANDRRYFGPLCLALAAGALASLRE